MLGKTTLLVLVGAVLLLAPQPTQACATACFPSCQPDDGRFLMLIGSADMNTLSGMPINVRFEPPRRGRAFDISVFDGDMRHQGSSSFWDHLNTYDSSQETHTLFTLSPCQDDTCTQLAAPIATATCDDMPDNGWFTFRVPADRRYRAYLLRAELEDPTTLASNQFKLRTNGRLLLTQAEQPFTFHAGIHSFADALTVYPELDPLDLGRNDPVKIASNMIGARYDGTFTFPLEVSRKSTGSCGCHRTLAIWDGDLDRGGYDGLPLDTDDADTPPTDPLFCAKLPIYAQQRIEPEGVALGRGLGMGEPPDENDPMYNDQLNRYYCRPPSVQIRITAPDGRVFLNENPSGNCEWERFCITDDQLLEADVHVDRLPWGLYWAEVVGMDHNNLNAWNCECTVWGLHPRGCTPGYWKQSHHFDSWVRFRPDDPFRDVFGVGPDLTLGEALSQGGGGGRALGRHAVAALLNAAQPGVDFYYAEAEVIRAVEDAWTSGQVGRTKDRLAWANERGCPID